MLTPNGAPRIRHPVHCTDRFSSLTEMSFLCDNMQHNHNTTHSYAELFSRAGGGGRVGGGGCIRGKESFGVKCQSEIFSKPLDTIRNMALYVWRVALAAIFLLMEQDHKHTKH